MGTQGRFQDLSGRVFGDRTVIQLTRRGAKSVGCFWRVRCLCGREDDVLGYHLLAGTANRCRDCARKRASKWGLERTTHGCSRVNGKKKPTAEYQAWCAMKTRCLNSKSPMWLYYGGRGIRVAEEWINSFDVFLRDMGLRPSPVYSLDRIDVDGPYSKENCRWATRSEQMKNRRRFCALSSFSVAELVAELHKRGVLNP